MKRVTRGVFGLAVLAASFGLLGPWADLHGASQRAVGGRVTDASSGKPVVGATVIVVATGLGTVTDSEGRFLVSGILEVGGPLGITFRHPCFHAVRVDVVDTGDVVVEIGLPFRPAGLEAAQLGYCAGYGPTK